MATRTPPQRKIRSPYSGSLFNCPRGCGCPDCISRPPRPLIKAIVALLALTVLLGGTALAVRAVWALIKGQW
jgi:hypothetical protein